MPNQRAVIVVPAVEEEVALGRYRADERLENQGEEELARWIALLRTFLALEEEGRGSRGCGARKSLESEIAASSRTLVTCRRRDWLMAIGWIFSERGCIGKRVAAANSGSVGDGRFPDASRRTRLLKAERPVTPASEDTLDILGGEAGGKTCCQARPPKTGSWSGLRA